MIEYQVKEDIASKINETNKNKENLWSKYATKNEEVERYKPIVDDLRSPFWRDADRIVHSLSYSRYSDKTQVFSFNDNDHISRRMTHVQLVSKVARTIGRMLNLNEDLIEAGALGHDIGHAPLGHFGEACLNDISIRELGEFFGHNIQGVRSFMYIDRKGEGSNLSIQVLDAVLCHNGEIVEGMYKPRKKTKEEFLEEYNNCYIDKEVSKKLVPMTLEGCVVRISDIIGYIGRDIEDAIEIGALKREELPSNITDVLGSTNSEIINSIIIDIVNNSYDKPYIKMSDNIYHALMELKDFNYKNIYSKAMTKEQNEYYKKGFELLYKKYLEDVENNNKSSDIYKDFLHDKIDEYLNNTNHKRMVIDYIAGMTDEYFFRKYKEVENNIEE